MARFTPYNQDQRIGEIIVRILDNIGGIETVKEEYQGVVGYDLDVLLDDVKDLLTNYKKIKPDDLKDFSFMPNYAYGVVPEDEGNSIRYSVVRRTNGVISRTSEPHEGVQVQKYMLRDIMADKENPGYKVLIYEKPMDNTIDFVSWSKNYRDAHRGAELFEELMETYASVLKGKGLIQMRYLGRMNDLYREYANYSLYGVPLRFFFRTNKLKIVYEKVLETLIIETIINKT